MLVLEDLASLWETPLDQHVLAAAPDTTVPFCSAPRGVKGWQTLGIPREAAYFNCGVLMIHLARWRQREVTRRVHQYLETTRDFLHQEALNAVLWDDWKPLDSRWNLLASRAEGRMSKPPRRPGGSPASSISRAA